MGEEKAKEKPKQVKIRLSTEEVKKLSVKAEKLGLTVPGYLKHLALNKSVKVKTVTISQKFDPDTARTLRGIATNLNQLARVANLMRLSYHPEDHEELMNLFRQLSEMTTAIKSIIGDSKSGKVSSTKSGILSLSFDDKLALIEVHDDDAEDVLVSDPSEAVRAAIAQDARDQDLDRLVSDPAWAVREAVAEQGRPEDARKLWRDPDWRVRRAVAASGCGSSAVIDAALASDPDPRVRWAADPLSRIDWENDGTLDRLVGDPVGIVRAAVADQGRDKDLDRLVSDPAWQVRVAVAFQGRDYDLDRLVHDPDPRVRAAVAMQGRDEDLDKLARDPDTGVRKAVAEHAN